MSAKKLTTVGCSDWHRGWGIGHNHIGKLSIDRKAGTYTWRGHCQGRHGQVWNKGMVVQFKLDADNLIVVIDRLNNGTLPDTQDVMEAIRILG